VIRPPAAPLGLRPPGTLRLLETFLQLLINAGFTRTDALAWMHRFAVAASVSSLWGIEMGVGVVGRPTLCVGLFHWIFRVEVGGSDEC